MPGSLGTEDRNRQRAARGFVGALFALLALLGLAACGDDGDGDAANETPAEDEGADDGGDGEDAGAPVDLGDPCSLLSADEAAEVAGRPMPGEYLHSFDATALYEGWAEMLDVDLDMEGTASGCIRGSVEIDAEKMAADGSQATPPGTVVLTSSISTLTKGTFDEQILMGNSEEDLSDELGLPAGLLTQGTEDDTSISITMIADDTHVVSVVGGIYRGDEQDSRALVLEAAERIAAKLT